MLCTCHDGQKLLDQVKANTRGGLCVAFQPYAKANNPLCPGYDKTKPKTWIVKWDVTSLYPYGMCQSLPTSNFRRIPTQSDDAAYDFFTKFVEEYSDSSATGAFFTVDLYFPDEVHDKIDMAPCKKGYAWDHELSLEQVRRRSATKGASCDKLLPYLGEHVRTMMTVPHLKLWMRLGAKVTKVYSDESWTFTQSKWLGDFIKAISRRGRPARTRRSATS
jgi:hypothetical protein